MSEPVRWLDVMAEATDAAPLRPLASHALRCLAVQVQDDPAMAPALEALEWVRTHGPVWALRCLVLMAVHATDSFPLWLVTHGQPRPDVEWLVRRTETEWHELALPPLGPLTQPYAMRYFTLEEATTVTCRDYVKR